MKANLSRLLKVGKRFGTIVVDPPWPDNGGKNGKGGWSKTVSPDAHYPTMSMAEILAMGEDIDQLARRDSHLYIWTTNLRIATMDVHKLAFISGFRPVTLVTWRKTTGYGVGQFFRGKTEHALFCVRGKPGYRLLRNGKRAQGETCFDAPRGREHSSKPEQVNDWAEIVSPGPYLELFARRRREGWTCWGNEVTKFNARRAA